MERQSADLQERHAPVYPVDGAAHDVAVKETAYAYRDATWSQVIIAVDPDPAGASAIREWAIGYWEVNQNIPRVVARRLPSVSPRSADAVAATWMPPSAKRERVLRSEITA